MPTSNDIVPIKQVTHRTLQRGYLVVDLALVFAPLAVAALFYLHCSRTRRRRRRQRHAMGEQTDGDGAYAPGEDCPICMDPLKYGCETMCGHAFCTSCLNAYWKSLPQGTLRPLSCPYCRQEVTLLVDRFSPTERADAATARARQADLHEYNHLHGRDRPRGPWQYLTHTRVLLRALARDFWRRPLSVGIAMAAAAFQLQRGMSLLVSILYVISPIDLLPEAALGFAGLVDDLAVVLFIMLTVAGLYRAVVLARARGAV